MNAALRRENVNGVYLALHAKTLKDLLGCVRDIPIHGLSITMPYKEAILKHLDNTDSHTTKIGACNTVVRAQDGKLYGFNTDAAGVVRPLEQRITLEKAKILVLGAGGAARAAVFGLKERGAEVYILNRTAAPAQKLARQARARTTKRADLKKLAFDVIINATPVGMGNTRESPLNENEINATLRFRHGLRSRGNAVDEDGERARRGSDSRDRDVRPPGGAPVRDLDRQARALGRHAAGSDARAQRTHRRPPGRQRTNRLTPITDHVGAGAHTRPAGFGAQKKAGPFRGRPSSSLSLVRFEVLPVRQVDYVLQHGRARRQLCRIQERRVEVEVAVGRAIDHGAALESAGGILRIVQADQRAR